MDKEYVSYVLIALGRFLETADNTFEIWKFVETNELEFIYQFLTCPFLEKRLRGINELREFIERTGITSNFYRTKN